jgi:hypothetical protein
MPQIQSHQGDFTMDFQSLIERVDLLAKEMHIRYEQIKASNHLQDDRLTQLMTVMEKLHTIVAGKGPDGGQSSGTSAGSDVDFIHGNGENGGTDHLHDSTASYKGFLPRIDLSVFDGTKPTEWLENCRFYFEYYQTLEKYKVQISAMNFSGEVEEWKIYYRLEHPDPPWLVFVEAYFVRFKEGTHLNPIVQFKYVNQTTTVTEYIREF